MAEDAVPKRIQRKRTKGWKMPKEAVPQWTKYVAEKIIAKQPDGGYGYSDIYGIAMQIAAHCPAPVQPTGNDLVLARVLREHWLSMIECLHDSQTDKTHCACGAWVSKPQPSVGDAVERWIEHVFRRAGIDIQAKEQLAASLPEAARAPVCKVCGQTCCSEHNPKAKRRGEF